MTRRGEARTVSAAVEEFRSGEHLELVEGLRDGRLTQLQQFGGPPDLTFARDGDETSQVPEADASRLLREGRRRTELGLHYWKL